MPRTKGILDTLYDEVSLLEEIGHYSIELGIIESMSPERDNENGQNITNAKIMFFLENGTYLNGERNIPPRPVLKMSIDYARKHYLPETMDTIFDGVFNKNWQLKDIEKELDKLGMRMRNYCVSNIKSKTFDIAPNAESTIKRKSKKRGKKTLVSDIPLVDTGQLSNAITYRLVRN